MKALFSAWEEAVRSIRGAEELLLLLDYDGTLTPIVEKPEGAHLNPKVRSLLASLAALPQVYVGVISGRSLVDVKERVGLDGIFYAGNHGLELEGPGAYFVEPSANAARRLMVELAQELKGALQSVPGALVEDKGLTISVHFRLVPKECRSRFEQICLEITRPYLGKEQVRLTRGKMVWELRPPTPWDKGAICDWLIRHLRDRLEGRAPFPIYVGDDRTDEEAFHLVRCMGGMPIFVGNEPARSEAVYRVSSTGGVRRFLSLVLELVGAS